MRNGRACANQRGDRALDALMVRLRRGLPNQLKTLATTVLTALSIAATVPVCAREVQSGYWKIYDSKGGGDNPPLCGMQTSYSDVNASIHLDQGHTRQRQADGPYFHGGMAFPRAAGAAAGDAGI